MKKLLLLLLVMALGAGVAFAAVSLDESPPGVFNPETIMAEYGVQQGVVTQPVVLVMEMPATADLSSFQAVLANDNFLAIGQPQSGYMTNGVKLESRTGHAAVDFYLRC